MRIQNGGTGGSAHPPLENYKDIEFLSSTGLDPLNLQSYQASIQCWAIIGTPVKRHFDGVILMAFC